MERNGAVVECQAQWYLKSDSAMKAASGSLKEVLPFWLSKSRVDGAEVKLH
jgi:hypothetical protein